MERNSDKSSGKFADFVGQEEPLARLSLREKIPWQTILLTFLAVFLICVGIGGFIAIRFNAAFKREQRPITQVIDEFMKAMMDQDIDRAYALFSPRVQRQMPKEKLTDLVQGKNYALFEGYQQITLDSLILSRSFNTDSDLPQGHVAKVTGRVQYQGDITGRFEAVLEKVEGTWRLYHINVTAPPEKFP